MDALPNRATAGFIRPSTGGGQAAQNLQTTIAMAGTAAGIDDLQTVAADGNQTETVTLPAGQFEQTGGLRLRGLQTAPAGPHGIGLRHRSTRIEQDPGSQGTVALGFPHEKFIGARIQLPVDLARLIAGFIGAILGEFHAGATRTAVMLADAECAGHPP